MKQKTYRDFLYDTNDIWLAIAILVIAALIIIWRINVIMDYPQTMAANAGATKTTEEKATTTDKTTTAKSNSNSTATATATYKNGKLTQSITVKVKSGSESAAVDSLVRAKLFKSYSEFKSVCKSAGVKPSAIKASTFTFAKGSTKKDIAKKVTK